MTYKVGDKIVIKKNIELCNGRHTRKGLYINKDMERFFGKSFTIKKVYRNDRYSISDGIGWTWDDCCFERKIQFK